MGVQKRYLNNKNRGYSAVEDRFIRNKGIPTLVNNINSLQNRVASLGTRHNARYFDANGQALPVKWRADSGDWLKTVEPQYKAIIAEADSLAEQLRGYKDYLDDDTYTKAMDAINATAESNRSIYTRARQEHVAFSPFTNEKDYNLVSPWIGQDEASALNTWNNLNRNKTLAYSEDNADMISEAEYALNLFADYYAGTGRSDSVSRMTQEYQQNRRIEKRDQYNSDISALDWEINKLDEEARENGANNPRSGAAYVEYIKKRNELTGRRTALKEERAPVDEAIRSYDASAISQMNQYAALAHNEDFDEKSQIVDAPTVQDMLNRADQTPTTAPTQTDYGVNGGGVTLEDLERQEIMALNSDNPTAKSAPAVDAFEFYISLTPEQRSKALKDADGDSRYNEVVNLLQTGNGHGWDQAEEDEIKMYRYIKNTQGGEAANKYLENLNEVLADRVNENFVGKVKSASVPEMIGMAMIAAPMEFLGGIVTSPVNSIVTLFGGKPTESRMRNAARVYNQAIMEKLSGGKEGFGWDDVYSAWQSSNVSTLASLVSMAFGDASGTVGTVLMGLGAAEDEMHRLYEAGATPIQISVGGAMAGFIEYASERWSVGKLIDNMFGGNIVSVRKLIGSWLSQSGVEGVEEISSTIANTVFDVINRGNRSDFMKTVADYEQQGMTQKEALGKACGDLLKESAEAFRQGVLSGAMGGASTSAIGYGTNQKWASETAKTLMQDQAKYDTFMHNVNEYLADSKGIAKVQLDKAIQAVNQNKTQKTVANLVSKANIVARQVSAKTLIEAAGIKNPFTKAKLRTAVNDSEADVIQNDIALTEERRKSVKKTYTVGNGVTTNAKTGEEIRITGIYRTNENEKPTLVFRLDDGSTIRSDEVSYANDNMAVMAEALAETGIRADYAQKLLDSVTEEGNAVDTVLGMRAAIKSGSIGENYAMARKEGDAAYLTDKQFKAAYEAGQLLGKNKLNKQIGLASQKTDTDANLAQEGGKFFGSFYDGTKTPVSALKNGDGSRTLTNTSKDGTVSSDDVKNMARNNQHRKDIWDDIYYPKSKRDASAFLRSFADQTTHLQDGQRENVLVYTKDHVYLVEATGYLSGNIEQVFSLDEDDMIMIRQVTKEFKNGINERTETFDTWSETLRHDFGSDDRGYGGDENTKTEIRTHDVDGGSSGSDSLGYNWESYGYSSYDEFVEAIQSGAVILDDDGNIISADPHKTTNSVKYAKRNVVSPNAQGGQAVKTTESKKADGEPNRLSVAVDRKSLLRSTTQAQVNVLESMAKLFNVNIEIYASSVVNGERQFTDRRGRVYKGNAAYTRVSNTILVDVNAGDYLNGLMLNAVSHELVHYVREMSPEKFQKLADFVVEKFGEKGQSVTRLIRSKQAKYAAQGETLSFDEAYEEVVADALESMLSQNADKVVSDVAELRKVDADLAKSLVGKLKDTVKKMLDIFKREGFHSKPETKEGQMFAEWTEYHDQLTRLFSEAVADAADRSAQAARRTAQKENTPAEAEVKNMARRSTVDPRYLDPRTVTEQDVKDMLEVGIYEYNARTYIPVRAMTPPIVSYELQNYLQVDDVPMLMMVGKARQMVEMDESIHDDRVDHAISSDQFISIMKNIADPLYVVYQKDNNRGAVITGYEGSHGKVALVLIDTNDQRHKQADFLNGYIGGQYNVLVTAYTLDELKRYLSDENNIVLRDKKNGISRGSSGSLVPSLSNDTPFFNDSISTPIEKINPSDEKKSLRNVTERQTIVEMLRTMNTEVEHNKYFQEYLQKASTLDRKQARLDAAREEWKELAFRKGKRSEETKAHLQELREEIVKLTKELDRTDKRLLELAELRPFRNMVANAEKRQREKDNKKMADYRKEVKRRAEREKVVRAMKDITSYILHETKDHRIPAELRKQFVDVLSSFNLDFSTGANKQVRHYLNDLADAIDKFQQSNSPMVEVWQDSLIQDMLKDAKERLGNTSIYNMTQDQLDIIYQLFRTMKKRITSANKIMSDKTKKSAMDRTKAIVDEVEKRKTKRSDKTTQFSFDNMKPLYFFERIGSDTLMGLYDNIRQGQNAYARDLMEADRFRQTVEKKYGAESWSLSKTKTFKDAAGEDMHLTLANIMSLYAHGRREQSRKHLFAHGIVLDEEVVAERNKAGKIERYKVDDKRNHPLNLEVFTAITSSLTKEQRAYIEEMQDYLSGVMGQKGNEISLAMYDLELFTEKHYWPLKTAAWWNAFNPEAGFDPKIKSPSFAKSTNKYATSPIVLQGFSAVWSSHVHDMSLYHGLALPVDDFTRVVNVRTVDNPIHVGGVRQALDEVYGKGAGRYITQLLRDLNGGIRATDDAWLTKGVSLAKKAATALSLSVAIQQPSSIMRAMAVIEAKYFGRLDKDMKVKGVFDAWEELKQYCPVAYIKEMGNMDTGVGRSAVEHLQKRGFGDATIKDILKDKNYRKQLGAKIDDIIGFLPQFMDQITWVKLWRSAQNKARALNPDLSAHEVKVKAAEIFDDCIERTQVYDSPLSRSGIMRKGGAATKQATAFLAEPTTTINMAYMATLNVIRNKPGARKQLGRTMGSILGATVLNAILKSIITAMRDDDEDETMIEKYVEHLVGNFMSDALIFTNLPYVRDIISLFEGYDVERMDMSTVGNLVDSIKTMTKDGITLGEVFDGVFSVAGLFGIPLKNVKREVLAIINAVETVADEIAGKRKTTWTGIGSAAREGLPFAKEANKGEMLYRAYASGDSKAIQTYRSYYDSESAANSGIKKALRKGKSAEIHQAAVLRYNGDVKGSARIVERIARETNIPVELVQQAVMAEVEAIVKSNEPEKEDYDGGYEETVSNPSKYTTADFKLAVAQGRDTEEIIDSIVADKKAQKFTEKQAKNHIRNSVLPTYKDKYLGAYYAGDKAEMERIISLLVKTGLWDRSAIVNIMKNYIKNEEDSK